MRILYFHQHFTTPAGSGGTRSYEFARALIGRGHEVTMVCGQSVQSGVNLPFDEKHRWHRGLVDGIDVISMPLRYSNRDGLLRRSLIFLRFAQRGITLALREKYDVLFATSTPLTAALPGIAMKVLGHGKPFVFEVRDLWPELPRALGLRNPFLLGGMSALEWLAYRYANACIGLAPGIVDGICHRAPAGRQIRMIPNGCDLELFGAKPHARPTLPGLKPSQFAAAFIGAHGIANGLDAVLDAAEMLKRRGREDIKLVLIGDGKTKGALVARAMREGLDNCLFIAPIQKNELARLTSCFDCGLMILANVPAFYYGTSPNKFFDYIAAGLPVINNYPGWLAEAIVTEKCGLVVPPDAPAALADALIRLADSPDLRAEMGRRARQLAETRFDRRRLAEEFVVLMENVVG